MKIKKATLEDAKKITDLIRRNILHGAINKYNPEQKKGIIEKSNLKTIKNRIKKFDVFCALKNNELIGTIYLGNMHKGETNIGGLYIESNKLNKGFGKKLLNHVENYAKRKGAKKIDIYSLRFAKEFYLKQGYNINKTYFWKIGETKTKTYGMEKKLK